MEVNVHYAKTQLSKLIAAAESGEEVIIARNGKAAVKMASAQPIGKAKRPRRELIGLREGKFTVPSDEQWKEMDRELEDMMLNGSIFPSDPV